MARVKNPLLSEKASGKFGKFIVFRCGKYVIAAPGKRREQVEGAQNPQREKFLDGARIWSLFMSAAQKTAWENFAKSIRHEKGFFTIATPLGDIWVRIGEKENWKKCIETYAFNGYKYFMSCYLNFGPGGWNDYPNPPPFETQ